MPKLEMLSSIEASKAARARLARSGAESFSTDENCRENHLMCDDCMAVCLDCNLDANAGGDICKFCSGESIERYDEIGLDAESFAYESEELIPVGTKVRSYDFWPHDETCYKEGVIVDHAPSPSCSPTCMHYHIRTTKVIRRGKSRPVDEGEIFMTHPYADMWDQEYPGQLAPHIQVISTAFPSTSTI
jgi:hypothetical protein